MENAEAKRVPGNAAVHSPAVLGSVVESLVEKIQGVGGIVYVVDILPDRN